MMLSATSLPPLAPHGWLPWSWEVPLFVLLAAFAALHRPLGRGTLGLGTAVVMLVVIRLGAGPAAAVAVAAYALASLFRRVARRWLTGSESERSGTLHAFGRALTLGLAVLVAGTVWMYAAPPAYPLLRWLGAPLGYGLVFAAALLVPRRPPPISVACAPLVLDTLGWWLGALLASAAAPIGWPHTFLLLAAFALLAAEAARNALLHGASDHRIGDLRRLQHAHQRIFAETSGRTGIAGQILTECANVLPVHTFQLEIFEPGGKVASWTAGPERALARGEPTLPSSPPVLPGVHKRARWRCLERQLTAEGECLAMLRLWCDPRRIEPEAEELFDSLVPHMASSLDRARLDREAKRDPLTDVPVRRVLESRLQQVYREACEEGRAMAVIMCDIDFFKKVNDTYGHAAGDEALILVARTLDSTRRERDICCRYGGEEFTVLLEDTAGLQALQLAERLRRAVEALDFVFEGKSVPLRLSAGVAAFPDLHIKTASELLLLADDALYQAKERGRNQVLLNLGQGAWRDAEGAVLRSTESVPSPAVPRIFG